MKREMKRVAGLPLPLYLALLGLLFLALWRGVIPAGMPGGLFLLLVLGEGLNELGKNVPIVRTYFGGSVVCVLGGAALSALGLFPAGSMGLLDRFVQQEGFLIFYIAALITGSLFQIDRRLLFRASLRILPTALAGVAAGTAVVVLLGLLQGFCPAESLLYIAIPMTSGGMTAGAVPLSGIYAEATGIPAGEILTRIAPATVLGNIVSILFGALSVQLSRRFPKISGGGQLLRGEAAEKPVSPSRIDFGKLLAGLVLSLAFYMSGALLHDTLHYGGKGLFCPADGDGRGSSGLGAVCDTRLYGGSPHGNRHCASQFKPTRGGTYASVSPDRCARRTRNYSDRGLCGQQAHGLLSARGFDCGGHVYDQYGRLRQRGRALGGGPHGAPALCANCDPEHRCAYADARRHFGGTAYGLTVHCLQKLYQRAITDISRKKIRL